MIGLLELILRGKDDQASIDSDRVLWYYNCLCVPKLGDFIHFTHCEAHHSRYSIYAGNANMNHDSR